MSSLLMLLSLVCLFYSQGVNANTEIINFEFPQHFDDFPASIDPKPLRLITLNEPAQFSLPISPGSGDGPSQAIIEFAYEIDPVSSPRRKKMEHWQTRHFGIRARRTARLSWPASHPADLKINLYSVPAFKTRSTHLFGGYLLITYRSTSIHSSSVPETFDEIPVTLVIEPCWIGGIPESLLGTLILVVTLVGVLTVAGVPQKVTKALRKLRDSKGEKKD
ncbi:hypothetical protein JCM3765_006617 [Sporobolomyces pararoseus]